MTRLYAATRTQARTGRGHRVIVVAAVLAATVAMLVLPPRPGLAYPRPGRTVQVSVGVDGAGGDADSRSPSISADGRHVAFVSSASNLVPGDTNARPDAFVRDDATGSIERVSVGPGGAQADGGTLSVSVSPDGRYVAYESTASNLVPDDVNSGWDVFVHDRETGRTELVSAGRDGAAADDDSYAPSVSADGAHVAFHSHASNMVPNDSNEATDIFVRDRETGVTELVSSGLGGHTGSGFSFYPAISADGRYVAFWSAASDLVPDDTNDASDVFVRDRETGVTDRVSLTVDGSEGNGHAYATAISADGRYVAFESWASNLVPGDTNSAPDVFVRDLEAETTERVSVGTDGREANDYTFAPSLSADGRHVAFYSLASNLVPGDTNQAPDVFVRDREAGSTRLASVDSGGRQGDDNSASPSLSADGLHVAFSSSASNLGASNTRGDWDVFVHDRGPAIGVHSLSVVADGDELSVSGQATFSGALIAVAADPSGDAAPGAAPAGGDLVGTSLTHRPEEEDVLFGLRLASLPGWSVQECVKLPTFPPIATCQEAGSGAGTPTLVYGWRFGVGGTRYEIRAIRAAAPATAAAQLLPATPQDTPTAAANWATQAFALYECELVCREIAPLYGGIGVTGAEVHVSVPMEALRLGPNGAFQAVAAFSALGDGTSGALAVLDEAPLPDASLAAPSVELGIAAMSTPEAEIVYAGAADVVDGSFSGAVDISSLTRGSYALWARSCLGDSCSARSTGFAVAGRPIATALALDVERDRAQVIVTATLTELVGGAVIGGAEIAFFVDDQHIGDVVTDGSGRAAVTLRPNEYKVHANWRAVFAGDDRYAHAEATRGGPRR